MAIVADVFISYHESSAGALAEQIADALESNGVSCWYARRDLPPGAVFSDYIPQAIRKCKVFLLILNEGSNQSEHVKNELNLAFRRINRHEQITLVPFRVDNCIVSDSIDYFISRFQITDGNSSDELYTQVLVEQILDILKYQPLKVPIHFRPRFRKTFWNQTSSEEPIQKGSCGLFTRYKLEKTVY